MAALRSRAVCPDTIAARAHFARSKERRRLSSGLLILNPYARRGRAGQCERTIRRELAQSGLVADLAITSAAGQAEALARQAADDGRGFVAAAGGDGTVHEVVNGLLSAAGDRPAVPLGILPLGAGNDFADMLGLPRDLGAALRTLAAGRIREVDVGQVRGRYFDNNCGIGLEPQVTLENTRIRRVSGNLRYLLALLKVLRRMTSWRLRARWDDGEFEGEALSLSVCNSPRTGGVFRMAPQARMDDGRLDLVIIRKMRLAAALGLVPRLLRGTHADDPRVTVARSRRVQVHCEPPSALHADGEMLGEHETDLTFAVLPGRLRVLVPAGVPGP